MHHKLQAPRYLASQGNHESENPAEKKEACVSVHPAAERPRYLPGHPGAGEGEEVPYCVRASISREARAGTSRRGPRDVLVGAPPGTG